MESDPERVVITLTKAELTDFGRTIAQEVITRLDAAERLHGDEPLIETGMLTVSLPGHQTVVDGTPVNLKTREFALLAALALNLGRVLTREQLLSSAWPKPERVDNRTVDVHVRCVRVALGSAASLIETVHGVGYKLAKAPARPPNSVDTSAGHPAAMSPCFAGSMEHELPPPPDDVIVDARRVAVVVRELTFDLLRAVEAAVPVALADAAGDFGPERLSRLAGRVFAETKSRYAASASATLLAVEARRP